MKIDRMYIMLRPVQGQASGFARLECLGEGCRAVLHLSGLSGPPARVLVLAGSVPFCAVEDLGLFQANGPGRWMLHSSVFPWHSGWHTIAVTADWPQPQLHLLGRLRSGTCFSLAQAQEAVAQYLSLPAPGACPAPEKPSVLQLPPRLSP